MSQITIPEMVKNSGDFALNDLSNVSYSAVTTALNAGTTSDIDLNSAYVLAYQPGDVKVGSFSYSEGSDADAGKTIINTKIHTALKGGQLNYTINTSAWGAEIKYVKLYTDDILITDFIPSGNTSQSSGVATIKSGSQIKIIIESQFSETTSSVPSFASYEGTFTATNETASPLFI